MFSVRTVVSLGLTVAIVGAGASGLAGCESKREKAHDTMLEQASSFRESLKTIPPQLDDVSRKMAAACTGQNPRRAQDVRDFSTSLEKLRTQGRYVASEANKAEVDANKYFTAWAQEAKQSNMADRSGVQSQAKASKQQVDTALRYLDQARDDFRDLVGSLDRIETKLKADQSEEAILGVQRDFGKAQVSTMNLRNYIDRLNETIDAALAAK
jgi:uncharacterized protein YdiU (UPF0061 family)